eukprot:CAMPEP_0179141460 /NCGR_PEP_ID=MMETSP0796-20121207/67848_1 /TAXON_ID=73915 /ORGANISM="Pyrodinium bahamense, Strain pbaha01" /LENGTH=61 /DNA_ID=CAMNT_0020841185 /DNA_START=279 /DNA_END=460 /DNA_ORIENTATION=+
MTLPLKCAFSTSTGVPVFMGMTLFLKPLGTELVSSSGPQGKKVKVKGRPPRPDGIRQTGTR